MQALILNQMCSVESQGSQRLLIKFYQALDL